MKSTVIISSVLDGTRTNAGSNGRRVISGLSTPPRHPRANWRFRARLRARENRKTIRIEFQCYGGCGPHILRSPKGSNIGSFVETRSISPHVRGSNLSPQTESPRRYSRWLSWLVTDGHDPRELKVPTWRCRPLVSRCRCPNNRLFGGEILAVERRSHHSPKSVHASLEA